MRRQYVSKGIIYKKCSRCGTKKPESEYNYKAVAADKLQYYCRKCNSEYCKEWASLNR